MQNYDIKKLICRLLGLLGMPFFWFSSAPAAMAAGEEIEITPILPENQITDQVGYYDLLLAPGQEQTIFLHVKNHSTAMRQLQLEVAPASTSSKGVVEYIVEPQYKSKAPFAIEKAVTAAKNWQLVGGETKEIPLTITMPEATYEGVVAGGLRISETDTKEKVNSEGVQLANHYTYVIALLLRQSEAVVAPDITVGTAGVQMLAQENVAAVELINMANAYIQDVRVEAVLKNQAGQVVAAAERSQMKIAPGATLNFPIVLEEEVAAGAYEITAVVYSDTAQDGVYQATDDQRYQKKWELTQNFTVAATKIHGRKASETAPSATNWLLLAGLVLVGSFGGLGYRYYRKNTGSS